LQGRTASPFFKQLTEIEPNLLLKWQTILNLAKPHEEGRLALSPLVLTQGEADITLTGLRVFYPEPTGPDNSLIGLFTNAELISQTRSLIPKPNHLFDPVSG